MTRLLSRILWLLSVPGLSLLLAAQQPARTAVSQPRPQTYRISGTIVDSTTGAILSHARVSVAPVTKRDDLRRMVTGEDGHFAFDGLSRGKYSLIAQHRGYLTQAFNQHDQYSSAVAVGPDIESENLVFRMRPDAAITGRVVDEYNEAVRNARVMAFSTFIQAGSLGTYVRAFASTDDQGHYRFSHLSPGKYYVGVSANPWYGRYKVEEAIGSSGGESDEGNDNEDSGNDKSSDKTPSGIAPLKTAVVPGPPPNRELDVAYPTTFYPNVTDSSAALQIVLGPGQKFVADFTLYAVPALHVLLPRGNSKQDTNLQVEQLLFNTLLLPLNAETRPAPGNRVAIGGIAPGTYILDQHLWENGKSSTVSSREVELKADGEIDTANDRLLVPVIGTVKPELPGTAGASGSVQVRNRKSGRIFTTPIGAGGAFEFNNGLLPGSYDVVVAAPAGNVIKTISAENAKATGATLQIPGTGVVTLTVVLTQGVGRVDGVALKDGKPFAGAMMVLVPEDAGHNFELFRRDQSDSDGTFTLNYVLPGNYTVVAIENGWDLEWFNPEALKPYLAGGTSVQVHSRETLDVKPAVQIAGGTN